MYIPLYNKSNYTLLSSLIKIDNLIEYATSNSLPAIALTDNNMYGTMEFIKKCRGKNIKPIIGLAIELDDYKIVLLAKNYDGYKSLIKLSTIQNEKRVVLDDLAKNKKEVICLIPYKYKDEFNNLEKIYSDIYLGYSNKQEEKEVLLYNKNVVFLRENLYLEKDDEDYLGYLYKIRDGKTINDEVDYDIFNHELNINNIYDFTDNTGLLNTEKIASSCELEFPKPSNLLPIYECDDPAKYLFELCKAGLNKRLNKNVSDEYKNRLSYELKVINDM